MIITMEKNICLICGFDGLEEPPYYEDYAGSNEICICCGFEFGVDDYDCDEFNHNHLTDKEIVEKSHILWRKKWVERDFKLFAPENFPDYMKNGDFLKTEEAANQLKNLELKL